MYFGFVVFCFVCLLVSLVCFFVCLFVCLFVCFSFVSFCFVFGLLTCLFVYLFVPQTGLGPMGFWRIKGLVKVGQARSVFRPRKMLLKPLVLQHLRK